MKTLEELRARLQEISAELEGITNFDEPETLDKIEALNVEFEDINKKIEAMEKVEQMKAKATAGRKSATPGQAPAAQVAQPRKNNNGCNGFDNMGEFFTSVKNFAMNQQLDDKLRIHNQAQQEKVGADGGFMVPDDLRQEIHKKFMGDMSLLSRCRQFNTSGNRVSLLINENAPWEAGGSQIKAYWENERDQHTRSKAQLKKFNIELDKLTAYVVVTEEMLEDAAQIESFIRAEAPEVMVAKLNNAIVSGDGVGKPQGFLNSAFAYEVAKEGGQTADTLVFNNIKKLHTHALPMAQQRGVFLYNAGVAEQLIGMKLEPTSTDSVSVYLPNNSAAGAPFGTLWGKPVFPMIGAMPQLGDKGDIAFADFSYYYAAIKTAGIKQMISTHVHFDTDEVAYKFSYRVGGGCPFKTPANTEYGDYKLSGITYLAERA